MDCRCYYHIPQQADLMAGLASADMANACRVQKKVNERATLNMAVRDIFHTWKLKRDIIIPYAQVHYHLEFDTQRFDLTFSYRFGKTAGNKERKTGIDAEAGRVN